MFLQQQPSVKSIATRFKNVLRTRKNFSLESRNKLNNTNEPFVPTNWGNKQRLLRLFETYLTINVIHSGHGAETHGSMKFYLIGRSGAGLELPSVRKLFETWTRSYFLLFNLFFYRLDVLVFGTPDFRYEIFSINWDTLSILSNFFKYERLFLFIAPSRINPYGDKTFKLLHKTGFTTALIIDTVYHQRNITYLHRAGFYTIGGVPTTEHLRSVNFGLPVKPHTTLSHFFFMRFSLVVKQQSNNFLYSQVRADWLTFLTN